MEQLDYLFTPIFANQGVLTGSFVRDCVARHEPICKERGIDVLVPFVKMRKLVACLKDLGGQVEEIDYDKQDRVARYMVMVDEWLLDMSCEYFYPPCLDADMLSWNYHGYFLWYRLPEDFSYGHSMDLSDIVARCKQKEAIVLSDEWEDKEALSQQIRKLFMKGWTLY
ncbi:hypothetical protein [Cedratvirus kamchatka]|uniref:Uncharacterized protein n=1 Tax=Cedratvirus kamchatka TaxID=2716914 RepID=A0A6G8MZ80_9VIRU|nr:hypothetical protein [Cedratvirus kamchatka]